MSQCLEIVPAVLRLGSPSAKDPIEMIQDPSFHDAIFIHQSNLSDGPDESLHSAGVPVSSETGHFQNLKDPRVKNAIDTALDAINEIVLMKGFRRIFFEAMESHHGDPLFGSDEIGEDVRTYITNALFMMGAPRTGSMYYMRPEFAGTYGYTARGLTAQELNHRMRAVDGGNWIDVPEDHDVMPQ